MPRRALVVALASLFGALLSPAVALSKQSAEQSGIVFVDGDADGLRDANEPGRPGVAVSNGRDVVETDADGRYRLPAPPHGFVSLTCPGDASCPVSFHRVGSGEGSADFGVVPVDRAEDFFFVHMSDVHAYENTADMADLLPSDGLPWWLPRIAVGWVLLYKLGEMYPHHEPGDIIAALRAVVSQHRDVSGAWDGSVMMDYVDLALDPSTRIMRPAEEIPRAFAEITALGPEFVVNTGDMVLEGNSGDAEAVERWYAYYGRVASEYDIEIHETIGNNELAGTNNEDFPPSDPRYGKVLFRRHFGPTHFSFERGPFHFAAVDTHRRLFDASDPQAREKWTFYEMDEEVRDWLDADLARARARGRHIVVLNHEPFFYDEAWDFDDPTPADDEGLFAKHGVAYELSGHIHRNGFEDAASEGGVTHITTGALSGFRWSLPLTIDSRGYRVVYAQGGRLYSAWKDLGEPLLGFVEPRGAATIHPASTRAAAPDALEGRVEVVAVGVDVDRPFTELGLWLDDEPLETTRWGSYFVRASFDAAAIGTGARLELRGLTDDGEFESARLALFQPSSREIDPGPALD